MAKKKILNVTAKHWSKTDQAKLLAGIKAKGFKYYATVSTPDGEMKFMWGYSTVDMEITARAQGFKIIRTTEL